MWIRMIRLCLLIFLMLCPILFIHHGNSELKGEVIPKGVLYENLFITNQPKLRIIADNYALNFLNLTFLDMSENKSVIMNNNVEFRNEIVLETPYRGFYLITIQPTANFTQFQFSYEGNHSDVIIITTILLSLNFIFNARLIPNQISEVKNFILKVSDNL